MVTVSCPTKCKCMFSYMGKVKEVKRKKEKGATEVTLLFDRCTVGVQVVQEVQVANKKEKGDFGGWRKVGCIRRSPCGDGAVNG